MIAYRSLFAMGTRLEIVLPEVDNEIADRIFEVIREEIDRLEKMLSIYIEDSDFSEINQYAGDAPLKVSSECFELISSLITYHKLTNGFFDPTLGFVTKDLFESEEEEIPLITKINIHNRIGLDYDNLSVSFKIPGIKLDAGAFGKGYALDSIKKILLSYKINNAFISFGDSSVMTIGKHPAGEFWKIGIRDLVDERSNAWIFEMNEGSVSTSGNTINNRRKNMGGHIFNPQSFSFEERHAVVSVKGPSAFETEILSTALFAAKGEQRKELMNNFPHYTAVELVYSAEKNKTLVSEIN